MPIPRGVVNLEEIAHFKDAKIADHDISMGDFLHESGHAARISEIDRYSSGISSKLRERCLQLILRPAINDYTGS